MHERCQKFAGYVSLLLLFGIAASGQTQDRSPDELIQFLTGQSRQSKAQTLGLFNCGVDQTAREDREAVRLLINHGSAAAPKLELFLDWLSSSQANIVPNVPMLLSSYAQIEGSASFPFLWKLHTSANFHQLDSALDDSIALSFGLTSYISTSQEPGLIIQCRDQQPRDALDLLIRSWQSGNREWLEASLGHSARAALTAVLKRESWSELRAAALPIRTNELTAVGYRFEIPNSWSEPQLKLEDHQEISAQHPELNTKFTSRSGTNCGERNIRFVHVAKTEPPAHLSYLVDNTDIVDLLRTVGSCAANP